MSEEVAPVRPPGNATAIGILHLFGALQSIGMGIAWVLGALNIVIATLGIGFLACCVPFLLFAVAGLEIYSGVKHLSSNQKGLGPPTLIAVAEISTILCCSPLSAVCGIIVLVLANSDEMKTWYAQKQLEA